MFQLAYPMLGRIKRSDLLVDFECYKVKDNIILKEIAFYSFYHQKFTNISIKTKSYKNKVNNLLIKHVHKIPFNYEKVRFKSLNRHLFKNDYITFSVNGKEKLKILSQFSKNVVDLNDLSYINKSHNKDFHFKCEFQGHIETHHCALYKIQRLAQLCNFKRVKFEKNFLKDK